jgi:hypothetical protein
MMPFTIEQFLGVFAEYNAAVYPMQFLLMAAALYSFFLVFKPNEYSSRFISAILTFFWLWMGFAYHLIFFSGINPVALVFGLFFILEAAIVFYHGVWKGNLSFRYDDGGKGLTGILLVTYALLVYPLLGSIFGHNYPQSPTFGLPCPTTIFTFGILLLTNKKVPLSVLLVPFGWTLIGSSGAVLLGIREDFGLLLAAFAGIALLLGNKRQSLYFAR